MKVKELSEKSGVHPETIRYYEKSGLLPAPQRLPNGYRIYGKENLEQLIFVKNCRQLGFSIESVKTLMMLKNAPHNGCADTLVSAQLAEVREKITGLQEIEAFLNGLRHETHHDTPCPVFERLAVSEHGKAV